MSSKSVITQLRFEPGLLAKINEAAERTGLSKADVMRLAMETGLEDLRRVDFDLPGLISRVARPDVAAAVPNHGKVPAAQALRVAEGEPTG
jgi:predicted DNA-binding protein